MKNFTKFLGGNRTGVIKVLLVVVGMMFIARANAATYYSRATGNWSATTTWSTVSHAGAAATAVPAL
jgi:hypothetical protein